MKTHDVNMLDKLPIYSGVWYVMNRGYLDFKRLSRLRREGVFFVTRSKKNAKFRQIYSLSIDKTTGLRCE